MELLKIKKSDGMSWPTYKVWIEKLLDNSVSISALRKSVLAVEVQRNRIAKNVHRVGRSELDEFLPEYYKLPGQLLQACLHSTTQVVKSEPLNSFEEVITASVNKSLAVEIVELKEKVAADEYQLTLKEKK